MGAWATAEDVGQHGEGVSRRSRESGVHSV